MIKIVCSECGKNTLPTVPLYVNGKPVCDHCHFLEYIRKKAEKKGCATKGLRGTL